MGDVMSVITTGLYPMAEQIWDADEYRAIDRVCRSGRFTMGPEVDAFERQFATYVGSRYAVMVNSGSSANLLMVAALADRLRGGNVIVPAVAWSTSYSPFAQYQIPLRIVDVSPQDFTIDLAAVEAAITPKTRGILAVHVLGAPCDLVALKALCDARGLLLLEDCCEATGAMCGPTMVGTVGACGTFSFFYSHHLSTMEGGMIVTDDAAVWRRIVMLRAHGWTRDLEPEVSFETSFRFVVPGYNVRPLEMSGALGQAQLQKLPGMLQMREENHAHARLAVSDTPLRLQEPRAGSSHFWLGGVIEVGDRTPLVERLLAAGISCRPFLAGNITRQPVIDEMPHTVAGPLPVADTLHEQGLLLGNHGRDLRAEIDRAAAILREGA